MIDRREITEMLENYHDEREAITSLLKCMVADGQSVFYPTSGQIGERVQNQFSQDKYVEKILQKCEDERTFYRKTIEDIKEKSEKLDRLMLYVSELPGRLKLCILGTMVNREPVTDYAIRKNMSPETVSRQRKKALDIIHYKFNRGKIRNM